MWEKGLSKIHNWLSDGEINARGNFQVEEENYIQMENRYECHLQPS